MPFSLALRSRFRPAGGMSVLPAVVLLCVVAPRSAQADARSALPPAVGDWKTAKPIVVYKPNDLENHIDGEAQAVKQYDFRQCAYAEYAPKGRGNQLITVDVFEMGSALDSYGYYSGQRNARARQVKIGAEGYQEPTALNFWKGPYYVRIAITATNPTPAFQQAMPKIAQAVAAKLNGTTSPPAILSLLPAGHTPRTEKYQRADVAGQTYLKNAVVARYPSAGPQAELFVSVNPNPAAAKAAYTKYQGYLSDPRNLAVGAKPAPVKGVGESAINVKTKFSGTVVAALKGKYVIAVRKAKDPNSATTLVKAAVARAK